MIFQGNPLKSPDALFSIRAVVKEGRLVVKDGSWWSTDARRPGMPTLCVGFPLILGVKPVATQDRIGITPVTVAKVSDGSLQADQTVLVENDRIATDHRRFDRR